MADPAHLQSSLRRAARRLEVIASELDNIDIGSMSIDEWLFARSRVGQLTAAFNEAFADIDRLLGISGAQARLIRYLQLRLGEVVTKEELSGVAGIYEWARRIRELRTDHGWDIHSAETRSDLHIGEYILERDRPDEDLARAWTLARRMHKLRSIGGAAAPQVRLLEYLKALYPKSADGEQMAYVAGSQENADRGLTQLADNGWQVVTEEGPGLPGLMRYRLGSLQRTD